MLHYLKWKAKQLLESHPYGYFIGNQLVSRFVFALPHEPEFYGFVELARQRGTSGLFLDLGANDGKSARSFHKLVKGWRILSIEGNPALEPKLARVKKKLPNFDYLIAAVDDRGGQELSLFIPTYKWVEIHSAGSASLDQARASMTNAFQCARDPDAFQYREVKTKTMTLDQLNIKPDIVKMDLEGGEPKALQGFSQTLTQCSPDFLIEYNPNNFESVHGFLAARGYRVFGFDVPNRRFRPFVPNSSRNCFFSKIDLLKKTAAQSEHH